MFKKLLRKLIKPIAGKATAAVLAAKADKVIVKELDKRTGGLASKADDVI